MAKTPPAKKKAVKKPAPKAPAKSATKKVAKVVAKAKPAPKPAKPVKKSVPPKAARPSAPPKAASKAPPPKAVPPKAKPSTPPKKPSVPPKAAASVRPAERTSVRPDKPIQAKISAPPPRRVESVRPSEIPEEAPRPQPALIRSPELENPFYTDARQRELEVMAVSAHPSAGLTPKQIEELHKKLLVERSRVLAGQERHLQEALEDPGVLPDETDMAQRSTEQAYLIRFADKERKLLNEIEHALDKMKAGEYGVCEGTDEAIGFKRLELRPWTRYSVAFKEQMERERSQHRR